MAFWAAVLDGVQYSVVIQWLMLCCNNSVKISHIGRGSAIVKT